jgi:hypothetical protein
MATSAAVTQISVYVVFAPIGINSITVAIAGVTTWDDTGTTAACRCGLEQRADKATSAAVIYIRVQIDLAAIGINSIAVGIAGITTW